MVTRSPRSPFCRRDAFLILRLLLLLITATFFGAISVSQADAQSVSEDWTAVRGWQQTASEAEALLSLPNDRRDIVSADRWDELRLQLTVQREQALTLIDRGTLKGRIARAQLAELGDIIVKGQPEPDWIKQRRSALTGGLAEEEAPMIAAVDVKARATVLIHDIDKVLKAKRRALLLEHRYPVLSPVTWMLATREIRAGSLRAPVSSTSPSESSTLAGVPLVYRLAVAAAIGSGALWLAFLARNRLRRAIDRRANGRSPRVVLGLAFLRDLLDIVIPLAALALLLALIRWLAGDLPFPAALSEQIILAGVTVTFAHWLATNLVAPSFAASRLMYFPDDANATAIRLITMIGMALAANQLLEFLETQPGNPPALGAILSFVVVAITSALLWRLAGILKQGRGAKSLAMDAGNGTGNIVDIIHPAAKLMVAVAIFGPIAALAGYALLSRYLLMSTVMSLATISTALFLYRSLSEAGALFFERPGVSESRYFQLLPLVFGFSLFVFTLPLVALMWGVSVEAIVDAVIALKNGVAVGQIRISFGNVMTIALVFLLGYALTRWLQRILHYAVLDRLNVEPGARAAILTTFGYVGLTLAALVAITAAGLDLSSLAFIAGALSVGVGFGLQSVVANFVSGIILLIERPIKVGDWIEVGGFSGHVRRIAFRSTHIETFDKHEVIVPNSELVSGSVTNLTYGNSLGRIILPVSIAYNSDVALARKTLLDAAAKDQRILVKPAPNIILDGLGESGINLNVMCFVQNVNERLTVRSDLYFAILEAFEEAGISIPFPQQEVWIRSGSEVPARRHEATPVQLGGDVQ